MQSSFPGPTWSKITISTRFSRINSKLPSQSQPLGPYRYVQVSEIFFNNSAEDLFCFYDEDPSFGQRPLLQMSVFVIRLKTAVPL